MSTVNEDLQNIAAALSNLAKDLRKIGRKAANLETSQPVPGRRKAAAKTSTAKKIAKKTAKKNAKTASKSRKAPEAADQKGAASVLDQVFDAVVRSRNGATIAKLKEKTGLESRQLSNALYKLSKRGKIESPARGLYLKKKG
jgi:predicted Rossmann fold nucleotide-binding protein DprA/Smf involved in DNA uptake